eukprot:SAG22_NODE_1115_length_5527_cov_2.365328_3_plen_222_part_00
MRLIALAVAALAVSPAAAVTVSESLGNASGATGTVTNACQILGRIPLKELRILAPETPVYSGSKAAVTVVFSRPVIKLGSNFGGGGGGGAATVNGVQPLLWLCTGTAARPAWAAPVAGRLYWVTTSILRFDPAEGWGNDLRCAVSVNPRLRSYDGAQLVGKRARKTFNTSTLAVGNGYATVSSAKAAAATDGRWQARLGHEADFECREPHDHGIARPYEYA